MDEQQGQHPTGHDADAPPGTGWPPRSPSPQPGPAAAGPVYGPPSPFPAYGGGTPSPLPMGAAAWPAAPAAAPRRSSRFRAGMAGLVAGALIGGGAGAGTVVLLDREGTVVTSPTAAQEVVIENPETATTATAAAAKAAPSVVTIYVSSGSGSGSGSGVVLTEDGYVLTNNHVVEGAGGRGAVQVRTSDGTLYDAEVVGTEPTADIAVVRVENASGLVPATFADSDEVQVGDVAVAIGAPLGLSNTVTDGIISTTNRAVNLGPTGGDSTVIDAIQTDAAINPGNSGGALVNGAGEVIGINTAIATVAGGQPGAQQGGNIGVGFAIPSNTAERIATELIEDGEAQRALLGVSATTEGDPDSAIGIGARVVSVEPGSAADDAGLQDGDVVTAIDDRPVTSSTELTAAVRSRTPGDEVTLTIRRDGESVVLEVTLGAG